MAEYIPVVRSMGVLPKFPSKSSHMIWLQAAVSQLKPKRFLSIHTSPRTGMASFREATTTCPRPRKLGNKK